ncbi:UDP-3-O-(3-hydroxymyristoyl)glucosamine N-acyltransferase [Paucibacter sp. APW11]|uniref:UDP-3-O-acylglucosamine N-acyltransferase n=1 Tax=Roseateles aquae TaxID=3077235 RepID=A0ABU3P7E2_9BURK|nr:UDP-3-O-(3-hydroxymyristoyl)glucosamine N-acyltransferase [Paucibacter sp. APW11]MDT8998493.1 UDP-3-O-(3-hydroxymyristoyl)glucosamine N-acyltransferase [Paucibacter sp. APW11]
MKTEVRITLAELIAALGGDLVGEANLLITRIGSLEEADAQTISFLANPRYQPQLASTRAGCVIVAPALAEAAAARVAGAACIVTPDPYLYFARLTQWWARHLRPQLAARIHPSAHIDASAVIGEGVDIGPGVVVEAGVRIGPGVRIGANSVIEREAEIGAGSRLAPRVTLGFECSIGARCIVHSGVVIGADGFGFALSQGRWEKIEQLGAVRIGDEVEIGANSCIDRGALGDTVLEDGVKLDNLVQIGHNVHVGAHTAMAGCAGVAGSARIGAHCTVGGGAIVLGHLSLADHVHVSAATVVSRSITKPGQYSGVFPFDDNASWEKNAATLRQLHALRDRIRTLEKKT